MFYSHSLCSDACMALLHRKILFPCGRRTSLKLCCDSTGNLFDENSGHGILEALAAIWLNDRPTL